MYETAKVFLEMSWQLLKGMPMMFLALLGVIVVISAFLSGIMCLFDCRKAKRKKTKQCQLKEKANEKMPLKKNTPVLSEDVVFEAERENQKIITDETIGLEMANTPPIINETIDVEAPEYFSLDNLKIENYTYNNIRISKTSFVDKIELSKSGIYLIFKDTKMKGSLLGFMTDEFIVNKKKKIPNPLFPKYHYKTLVNKWFKTNESYINVLILAPKIKESNPAVGVFKSIDDIHSYINSREEVFDDDMLYNLSESVYFLEKRR